MTNTCPYGFRTGLPANRHASPVHPAKTAEDRWAERWADRRCANLVSRGCSSPVDCSSPKLPTRDGLHLYITPLYYMCSPAPILSSRDHKGGYGGWKTAAPYSLHTTNALLSCDPQGVLIISTEECTIRNTLRRSGGIIARSQTPARLREHVLPLPQAPLWSREDVNVSPLLLMQMRPTRMGRPHCHFLSDSLIFCLSFSQAACLWPQGRDQRPLRSCRQL